MSEAGKETKKRADAKRANRAKIGRDDKIWFVVASNGTKGSDESSGEGPFSLRELRQRFHENELTAETLIKRVRSNGEWFECRLGSLVRRAAQFHGRHHRSNRQVGDHFSGARSRVKAFPRIWNQIADSLDGVHWKELIGDGHRRKLVGRVSVGAAILLLIFLLIRVCGGSRRDDDEVRSTGRDAGRTSNSIRTRALPAVTTTGWGKILPNCGPVINNGILLAQMGNERGIFPNVRVDRDGPFCPSCPVRAIMIDGTALVLQAGPTLLPRLVASPGAPVHLCGELTARHAGAAWLSVSQLVR